MTTADLNKISPVERPDYQDLIAHVAEAVWPEFMLNDPVADKHWDGLFENFPEYQYAFFNPATHIVAGIGNSVPLSWGGEIGDLPTEGWEWALIKAAADYSDGMPPNMLCGIQISITPEYQGQGMSRVLLQEMVSVARRQGLPQVIVPVRPSMKHRYPLTPIDSYILWLNDEGLPFDPWLRVHVRNGGRIIKPCHLAMRIPGSIGDWESWTGMRFPESGTYIVPGALEPIRIDMETNQGEYIEPNVWVVHDVQ